MTNLSAKRLEELIALAEEFEKKFPLTIPSKFFPAVRKAYYWQPKAMPKYIDDDIADILHQVHGMDAQMEMNKSDIRAVAAGTKPLALLYIYPKFTPNELEKINEVDPNYGKQTHGQSDIIDLIDKYGLEMMAVDLPTHDDITNTMYVYRKFFIYKKENQNLSAFARWISDLPAQFRHYLNGLVLGYPLEILEGKTTELEEYIKGIATDNLK